RRGAADRARRLCRPADASGCAARAGRCILRPRHGHGRRRGAAREPARTAGHPAHDVPARRRHLAAAGSGARQGVMGGKEDRLWARARAYLEQGNADAARVTLETLLRRTPGDAAVHLQLAGLAYAEDRLRDCTRHTVDAAQRLPNDVDAILRTILTLLQ